MNLHHFALLSCILMTAFGQIFLRAGMSVFSRAGLFHPLTIGGYTLLALNAVLAVYVLQSIPLKTAASFGALSFPLVVILSRAVLKESVSCGMAIGSILIVFGIGAFTLA